MLGETLIEARAGRTVHGVSQASLFMIPEVNHPLPPAHTHTQRDLDTHRDMYTHTTKQKETRRQYKNEEILSYLSILIVSLHMSTYLCMYVLRLCLYRSEKSGACVARERREKSREGV